MVAPQQWGVERLNRNMDVLWVRVKEKGRERGAISAPVLVPNSL